jgi:hypothetical protein
MERIDCREPSGCRRSDDVSGLAKEDGFQDQGRGVTVLHPLGGEMKRQLNAIENAPMTSSLYVFL